MPKSSRTCISIELPFILKLHFGGHPLGDGRPPLSSLFQHPFLESPRRKSSVARPPLSARSLVASQHPPGIPIFTPCFRRSCPHPRPLVLHADHVQSLRRRRLALIAFASLIVLRTALPMPSGPCFPPVELLTTAPSPHSSAASIAISPRFFSAPTQIADRRRSRCSIVPVLFALSPTLHSQLQTDRRRKFRLGIRFRQLSVMRHRFAISNFGF